MVQPPISLYIHIPFCSTICHYCDFAKTANFTSSLVKRYFQKLTEQLKMWCKAMPIGTSLQTVYLGGGTPGLFTYQLQPLLACVTPYLNDSSEITIEANPQDVNVEKILYWQQLGINRLSLGIQTFSSYHLKFLHRSHSWRQGVEATLLAKEYFHENVSIDLIYGFPEQTITQLEKDLEKICELQLDHVSLYNLIYEKKTPIGRAKERGKIKPLPSDLEAKMYQLIEDYLSNAGFYHYEISNWAKKKKFSRHNLTYWKDKSYLGVGSGAHGYLSTEYGAGTRYFYDHSERRFIKNNTPKPEEELTLSNIPDCIKSINIDKRSTADWLLEYLATGLRTYLGVDLQHIERKSNKYFSPRPVISSAIAQELIKVDNNVLYLTKEEWFRENYWIRNLFASFN